MPGALIRIDRRPRGLALMAMLAVLTCVGASACGGGGGGGGASFKKGGEPAPADCLKRWNENQTAVSAGLHSYVTHFARGAQVRLINDRGNGLVNRCLVVFAVEESDKEYGIVGEVELPSGWNDLRYLPEKSADERLELQRRAAEQANARVEEDGRLAPL